ncbi:MAG: site-specific integrase, partial [Thiocapsa sp.]
MATIDATIDAFVASRQLDRATLSRLAFWSEQFGDRELAEITPDDVDAALVRLAERGRLRPVRGQPTEAAGRPLAGSTLNRYISQLGSLFRYARRLRLLPRAHVPPTRGIEKAPEPMDPGRYLRPEEVERILAVARVLDVHWGRLPALVVLAFHTGLRVGNLLALRWRDVDLEARTATVLKTKNGRPMVAALSERAVAELRKLPGREPDRLVFASHRTGRPYQFRALWERVTTEAGLPGRNFHQIRHGCGSALAQAGVGQAQ